MGREIRNVPLGWEHPKTRVFDAITLTMVEKFKPLLNKDFETAAKEWKDGYADWYSPESQVKRRLSGEFSDGELDCEYWQYHGQPPAEEYYRPKWTEQEACCFQMYETVSEGTPVSPVFRTKQELADYLVENGDYWDQKRGHGGWSREAAQSFVGVGWAPSGMGQAGVGVFAPRDKEFWKESK